MNSKPVYLDYNATTPCDPRVLEVMLPYFTQQFGNAASADHLYGWAAQEAVEEARWQVAQLIGASSKNILFTSGATESINLALKGLVEGGAGNHIITCKTEHQAVLDTCRYLEAKGIAITWLGTDDQGQVSLSALEAAIRPDTVCICMMYANNETGVIHPVNKIAAMAQQHGVPFFCDATQAAGKIPLDVTASGIDLLALSAHKIYGPKGVGALYMRSKRLGLLPQMHGGHQEGGFRAGTTNTPGIVGFGKAAELCLQEQDTEAMKLRTLRDKLEQEMKEQLPSVIVNGGNTERLPHVSNLLLPWNDVEQLLLSLSAQLAVSRGSACSRLVQQPSHVLQAMGLNDLQASQAIRISLGRFTTATDIQTVVEKLCQAILQPATAS